MDFLRTQYESVLKTGKPDRSAKLGPRADLSGSWPIFTDRIKQRIQDAHFEMTALSIGIQLELDAMNFYKSQAESSDDPEVKRFYTELADWESPRSIDEEIRHWDRILAKAAEPAWVSQGEEVRALLLERQPPMRMRR